MTQIFNPVPRYKDALAAIDFLKEAFGFEERSVAKGDDEATVVHAELVFNGAVVGVSSDSEGSPFPAGPSTFYVVLDHPDEHHARAVAAGAEIVMELTDQPYGSREYAAKDPEGNVWCFGTYRPEPPA